VPALVALLEVPGIVVALLLARRRGDAHWGATIRELLTGKSVVLLAGGLAIGWVTGRPGFAHVAPLFEGLSGERSSSSSSRWASSPLADSAT
jgi:hypothetical protein